ncbi:hypothetical protein BSKO_05679 [Bryopsis sp. KO-2023]|nr:hypothetical protein BSKO_05679 [Bryopsis sp. KO-2023]
MTDLDQIGPQAVFVWLNADEVLRRRYAGTVGPVDRQFFRASAERKESAGVPERVGQNLAKSDSATFSTAQVGEKRVADGGNERKPNKKKKKVREPSCGELVGRALQSSVKKVVGEAHSRFKSFLDRHPVENLCEIPSQWGDDGLDGGISCASRLIFKTREKKEKRRAESSRDVTNERSDWVDLFAMKAIVRPKFCMSGCGQNDGISNETGGMHQIYRGDAEMHEIQHAHARVHAESGAGAQGLTEKSKSAMNLFGVVHQNPSPLEAICHAHDTEVVMPGKSAFLMSDMGSLGKQVGGLVKEGKGFDLIVLDPPWENKSVSRKGLYQTVSNWALLKLPMEALMQKESCLVVLWMTNRMKHQNFVEQELLPKWGLKMVTTWFWLKVDSDGEMICSLEGDHHYPYEKLFIATNHPDPQHFCHIPKSLTVVAMPGEHSRKPPLNEIVQSLLPSSPFSNCLEMFARELTPGWSSWGNEVLHFQNSHRFVHD